MRTILLAVALGLVACDPGTPPNAPTDPAKPATTTTTAAPTAAAPKFKDPQAAATAFGGLLAKCDRVGAKTMSVSFEDLSSMVKSVPSREAWDAPLDEKIEKGCKTFATGKISGVRIVDQKHLTKAEDPDKFKRDIEAAIVRVSIDGKELDEDMDFIETDAGWKFSAQH